MPASLVPAAPVTGPADVRHLLPELHVLLARALPLLQEAALLCAQVSGVVSCALCMYLYLYYLWDAC